MIGDARVCTIGKDRVWREEDGQRFGVERGGYGDGDLGVWSVYMELQEQDARWMR